MSLLSLRTHVRFPFGAVEKNCSRGLKSSIYKLSALDP
jgi:hypothetical protein